jgi:Glycerophosphoryl diester phosphodiesterase
MLIIAHRGASHDAPENTLASVKLGWAQDADAVEIDVYRTRDDEIVALHDHTFQRTAGHPGDVEEMDLAEIRTLDVGAWKGPRFAGERVPTLAEVLATVPGGKSLVIEIKSGPVIVPALQRVLRAGPVPLANIVLISFNADALAAAKRALPECVALLLEGGTHEGRQRTVVDLDALIRRCHDTGFDGLDLGNDWPIDAAFVRRVHDAKLLFYVWTVNRAENGRELADAGIDGLTTDRPGWMREMLRADGALSC